MALQNDAWSCIYLFHNWRISNLTQLRRFCESLASQTPQAQRAKQKRGFCHYCLQLFTWHIEEEGLPGSVNTLTYTDILYLEYNRFLYINYSYRQQFSKSPLETFRIKNKVDEIDISTSYMKYIWLLVQVKLRDYLVFIIITQEESGAVRLYYS